MSGVLYTGTMTRKKQKVIKAITTLICIAILYGVGNLPKESDPKSPQVDSSQRESTLDNQISVGSVSLGDVETPLELPAFSADDPIFWYNGFTLLYDETHEQARWVAYELTADEVLEKVADRTDNFRPDPQVASGSAHKDDYYKSGYDRGHLAPAGDLGWSEESMSDSFYFTNMSPQEPGFNRGIWRELEELMRDWAVEAGSILITTGPILEEGLPSIGENQVSIPKSYYKVIIDYTEPVLRGVGFIMDNKKSSEPLASFAVPIDQVEELTGIDFFFALPDQLEEALEADYDESLWVYE